MSAADTPANRAYIQKHKLWMIGEVITMKLIFERSEKPLQTIIAVLNSEKDHPTEAVDPPPPDVAAEARDYLQRNRVAFIIEDWLKACLDEKPDDPLSYSIDYFTKQMSKGDSEGKSEWTGEKKPHEAPSEEEASKEKSGAAAPAAAPAPVEETKPVEEEPTPPAEPPAAAEGSS
jgi:hypothetical protein